MLQFLSLTSFYKQYIEKENIFEEEVIFKAYFKEIT